LYIVGEAMAKKRLKLPISSARRQLFELADLVRKSGDDTVVVFEQRGQGEGVALVRESRLAFLEARVAELDKRATKPFTARGSLKLAVSEEEFEEGLRQIRREWSRTSTIDK
jgi:hypothetical protein